MKKFEFIEHTADVCVRVFGNSSEDLFVNSALALFSLLVDVAPQPKISKEIILEAESLEDLLVEWLNELISGFFADKFLPAEYELFLKEGVASKVLKAKVKGQDFDPYANKINMEIKAATYHNLKIKQCDTGCKTEIIFDV